LGLYGSASGKWMMCASVPSIQSLCFDRQCLVGWQLY
jgi:hypothetical protein